jgi:CHAT domain-containing protein
MGTGGAGKVGGEEVESFAALAQSRGAQAILATLWPVSDASTARFMRAMYRRKVQDGLTKAEALRQTQLAFLRGEEAATPSAPRTGVPGERRFEGAPLSHPYYWAPFVLTGNWR